MTRAMGVVTRAAGMMAGLALMTGMGLAQDQDQGSEDVAEVGGQTLTLRDLDGLCAIFPSGAAPRMLDLPSPCAWARTSNGAAHRPASPGAPEIALVVGPPAHPGDAALSITGPHDARCSHIGQAIAVAPATVSVGPVSVGPFGFCPTTLPDAKDLDALAD